MPAKQKSKDALARELAGHQHNIFFFNQEIAELKSSLEELNNQMTALDDNSMLTPQAIESRKRELTSDIVSIEAKQSALKKNIADIEKKVGEIQAQLNNIDNPNSPQSSTDPSVRGGLHKTKEGLGEIWAGVKKAAGDVADAIKAVPNVIKTNVVYPVGRKLDSINDAIWDTADKGVKTVGHGVEDTAERGLKFAKRAWKPVAREATKGKNLILSALNVLGKKVANPVRTKYQWMKTQLGDLKNEIKQGADERNKKDLGDDYDAKAPRGAPGK